MQIDQAEYDGFQMRIGELEARVSELEAEVEWSDRDRRMLATENQRLKTSVVRGRYTDWEPREAADAER